MLLKYYQAPHQARLALLRFTALVLILLIVLFGAFRLLFPFGLSSGSPYSASNISGIVIQDGTMRTRLPALYAPCWGSGEFTCYGLIAGKRLSFSVSFDQGRWLCKGKHGGKTISCGGVHNSDNVAEPRIYISASALGLETWQLNVMNVVTKIAPFPFMRWVWIALVPLYVWTHWRNRKNLGSV